VTQHTTPRTGARRRLIPLLAAALLPLVLGGCRSIDDFRRSLVATKYISRGNELLAEGERAAALADFARAQQLRSGDRQVERLLIYRYALAGAPERAESLLRGERVPADVYWALGNAFFQRGDRDKGVAYCEKALAADPKDPVTLNNVGFAYADNNIELQRALELVLKASLLKPNQGYIIDSVGWAYYKLGQLKEARSYLERAVKMSPESAEIRYHLGALYSRVGMTREARTELETALRYEPSLEPAREELRRLHWALPVPPTV
jgi:tetratricopeptide (TPR) repeat protein